MFINLCTDRLHVIWWEYSHAAEAMIQLRGSRNNLSFDPIAYRLRLHAKLLGRIPYCWVRFAVDRHHGVPLSPYTGLDWITDKSVYAPTIQRQHCRSSAAFEPLKQSAPQIPSVPIEPCERYQYVREAC